MSYSKLIHEYLDGQLNMVREDVLFAELAKNPDLRIDFNQQVQLQNVAFSDMRTISPPADSTQKIFSALGFTIPGREYLNRISAKPENSITSKTVAGSAMMQFWKKHASTVAAVVITASLTTAVFLMTSDRFAPVENAEVDKIESNIPLMSSTETVTTKTVEPVQNSSIAVTNPSRNRNTPVAETVENEEVNLAQRLRKAGIVALNSSQNIDLASSFNSEFSTIPSTNVDPFAELLNLKPAGNFNDGDIAFIANIPTMQMNSNVKVNIPESGIVSKINLTILFKKGENWYIGGQFGKEDFAIKTIRDIHGVDYNYQQQTPAWFAGLTARYSYKFDEYFELGRNISPYLQLFGGSTNFGGLLGSIQGGLSLAGYKNLAINIGYEYKAYVYQIDKSIEYTNKYGFIFGAGISF